MFKSLTEKATEKLSEILGRGSKVWFVISRVEDEDSQYASGPRISSEILREVADNYDPSHLRAPVVQSVEGIKGRAHEVGELNPPAGWIERVSFDGVNLWALAKDVGGRLNRFINREGLVRGSVGLWPKDDGGNGYYLRHFALIAGQKPGTGGLPHLDEFYAGMDSPDPAISRAGKERAYITRSIGGKEEVDMEKEEVQELISGLSEGLTKQVETLIRASDEKRQGEIKSLTDKLDEATNVAKQALERAEKATAESTERVVRSAVEQLSRDGKVPPAEVDGEVAMLVRASEDERKSRLALIGARNPMAFGEDDDTKEGAQISRSELSDGRRRLTGINRAYDEGELRQVLEFEKLAGGDINKKNALLREALDGVN